MRDIIFTTAILVASFFSCNPKSTNNGTGSKNTSSGNSTTVTSTTGTTATLSTPPSTNGTTDEPPIVGGDRDAHGCIGSAGYIWSEIRKTCVRIWEVGVRLNAKAAGIDQTTSAFIIAKSDTDDSMFELVMPSQTEVKMLAKVRTETGVWKNATYKLTLKNGTYSLSDNAGKVLYDGKK